MAHQNSQPTQKHLPYSLSMELRGEELIIQLKTKNKDNKNEIYSIELHSLENLGKLSDYFEDLHDLKQYMGQEKNVIVNIQQKSVDIIAKGVTKKSTHVSLAKLQLTNSKAKKNICFCSNSQIEPEMTEQWLDELASDIVTIIESKSKKIIQNEDIMEQYVKKSELNELIQQVRKSLFQEIERSRIFIKDSKLQLQKPAQKLSNERVNTEEDKGLDSILQTTFLPIQSKVFEQMISKLKNEEIAELFSQIALIQQKIDTIMPNNESQQIGRMVKDEGEKLSQELTTQLNAKWESIKNKLLLQKEIDAINKKIQLIEGKIQSYFLQVAKNKENTKKINQILAEQEKKISQLESKTGQRTSRNTHNSTPTKSNFALSLICPSPAQQWLDNDCVHIGRVSLQGSSITLTSLGGATLFSKRKLTQKSAFNIEIQHMANKIIIGVIDTEYKTKLILSDITHKISYENTKKLYCGRTFKQEEGLGYKQGEIITIIVDIYLGTIIWKVGDSLRLSWQSDELRNNKIIWVPYVQMFNKGDKISILQ